MAAFQAAVLVLSCTLFGTVAELNIHIPSGVQWAEQFSTRIREIAHNALKTRDFKQEYFVLNPTLTQVNGNEMIQEMKVKMEEMLSKKVKAIRELVVTAEEAYKNHKFNKSLKIDYPRAKELVTEGNDSSVFLLKEEVHFNNIPVNLNLSTVHVPTNVYDQSAEVLNGVAWSEALNRVFIENKDKDPTLTWQYFGSAEGFFRNYPGIEWNTAEMRAHGIDMYDCRTRGWYIQAATSPKDVIILLDASGSMTGLRMQIAKATVEKILDTLSDDDYFNVMQFADNTRYIDECFNSTLVQANADNKKRVKEALSNVTTSGIAGFPGALTEAFELLNMMNASDKGAQCNRAIMIITDGAPENYKDIFEKYNWPNKNVRVFTFLIGREVSDTKQVKWMACANKGYFSHISTLADVHEHVQDYIHVISRPMVIERSNHTIWTSVYIDAAGLRLMTSVAQPVFDTKNDTKDDGILLGVMGTDVPVTELTKLTPQYKLGVNGYAFAITNNGYVVFHPDFRPTEGEEVKPNYNSVDLSEVELSDIEGQLRRKMVDRETGHMPMTVKIHYDDMKRVTLRKNHYYFTDIADTPFSLGIALPDGYGDMRVEGKLPLSKFDMRAISLSITEPEPWADIKIAPWEYCQLDTNETRHDPVQMLIKYLQRGQLPAADPQRQLYWDKCDNELIESLLFDLTVTRGAVSSWMNGLDRYGQTNADTSRKHGIELVFIGTKAGLTRYYKMVENLTDPYFIQTNISTIDEMYYKRAVMSAHEYKDPGIHTISVPFDAGKNFDVNDTMVTIAVPFAVQTDNTNKQRNAEPLGVASVLGLQMRYANFYSTFMEVVEDIGCIDDCNLTCASDQLECYLIDNNGFIVLSEYFENVGRFIGEIEPNLMKELTISKSFGPESAESQTGIFEKVQLYDYQGLCEIWRKGSSDASTNTFSPLRLIGNVWSSITWLLTSVSFLIQEVALLLVEFNIASLWQYPSTTVSGQVTNATTDSSTYNIETSDEEDDYSSLLNLDYLAELASSKEEYDGWISEIRTLTHSDNYKQKLNDWYISIKMRYGLRKIGSYGCILLRELYMYKMWDGEELARLSTMFTCSPDTEQECFKSYSIQPVPRTNLMLLALDATCYCNTEKPISVVPEEVEYNDTMMCQRLQQEIYRQSPPLCYAYHPKENDTNCGLGHTIKPSLLLTAVLLLLSTVITLTLKPSPAVFCSRLL